MEYALFPTVGEIAQKNICQVEATTTVRSAAALMHERGISSVVIVKNGLRYLFTVEDLLHFASLERDTDIALFEVLSHRVQTIHQDERVLAALELLDSSHERYLGVTDGEDKLVGIVTYTDILSSIDPSVLVEKKTIGELISRNTPTTFTADWILDDVLSHLNRLEDAIIVVENRVPIGIVTTKDLFKRIATGQSTAIPLSSIMSAPVATTPVTASIQDVLVHLKSLNVKRVVVVNEQNAIVGVVTQSQLVGFAYGAWINLIKHHASELRELVSILENKARDYEKQALLDPLTQLPNRRLLHQRLEEEVERMRRYETPSFSVVLIDIDNFKGINSTFGHQVGDQVLQALSQELKRFIRKADIAVRWGGDVFAVLMPNTGLQQAVMFADRLLHHVANLTFLGQISLTISLGANEFLLSQSPEGFICESVQTLALAKAQGKNCVACTPRHTPEPNPE